MSYEEMTGEANNEEKNQIEEDTEKDNSSGNESSDSETKPMDSTTINSDDESVDKNEKKGEAGKTKKKTIFDKLGNASDKTISIFAMIAMCIIIAEPIAMVIYDINVQKVDLTLMLAWNVIIIWIFPAVSVLAFILYLLVFMRIRKENTGLLNVIKRNPVFVLFSLTVIWMLVSQICNGMETTVSEVPDYVRGESFDMQYSYFIFILFAATQVRLEAHKRWLLRIQMFSSVMVVIAAFILWHTQDNIFVFIDWEPVFSSIFSNLNYYGYYLAISVPLTGALFIYEKNIVWKIIAAGAFIANTVALSINNCTGAWMGAAFGVLFVVIAHLIIEKKFNWQSLALILAFIVAMYIPGHILGTFEDNLSTLGNDIGSVINDTENAEDAGTGRWRLWMAGLDIVKDNKWFGIGFEGVIVREYIGAPYMTRPHNEFLQHAMFYGIPMVVFYFLGCFGVFLRALRKRKIMTGATLVSLAGAFGYLVSSFFGLTVFTTAMYLFVFMGMGYVRDVDPIESVKAER